MIDPAETAHQFEFQEWADERLEPLLAAESLRGSEPLRLWSHVVAVQELWLARVLGEDYRKVVVWPEWDFATAARRRAAIAGRWRAYVRGVQPAELERRVRFTNSQGQECSDPVEAILRQVVSHGIHHRAQIALLLRGAGIAPPGIDYIMFRRARAASGT